MPVSRRELLKQTALSAAVLHLPATAASAAQNASASEASEPIALHWLEGKAPSPTVGTTWGVPWAKGKYRPGTPFALTAAEGKALPLQTWPLAYWPDGSLKWTGHAFAAGETAPESLHLLPGQEPASPATPMTVKETADAITVETGALQCRFARKGAVLVTHLQRGDKTIARDLRLVCLTRSEPEMGEESKGISQQRYSGIVSSATVEQTGPVRTVVRVEGKHQVKAGQGRAWMPFTLRFYFYASSESIRILHTFIFDGDEQKDFISGLGLRFSVPLSDPLQDRHIRFAGEDGGLWGEATRTLTGLRRDPGAAVRAAQVAGQTTPPAAELPPAVGGRLELIPAWGDYRLSQLSADGFQIDKRTKAGHTWIRAAAGQRAPGLGYIGGATGGGIAFGLRHFWQKYPSQLTVHNAATKEAEVTVWLWSPDAPPMDLRFYHDGLGMTTHPQEREGLEITYEDYEKGWGTPQGIAHTSELFFWAFPATPPREKLAALAATLTTPPLLACTPEHLHAAGVFSTWSLPERRTPAQKAIEDQLDFLLEHYEKQVQQRRWYGFWDFGDVMHSYDRDRHEWCYDVGGFAWANSELSPDLWLWYSYLRSGRADVFRLAEAMTRHTSEVDVYHQGQFRGFGSRHNVQHWGDSSKQPRVSTAAYRRIFYYLTADERTGDLMREPLDSDQRLKFVDIGRKLRPVGAPPLEKTHVGFGTDWGSLCAAWLTEWERTGDTRWRDKIVNGMQTIGAFPKGWFVGGADFDTTTGRFSGPGDTVGISHLNSVFGAAEINAELLSLLDVPEYKKAWVLYCRAYNAPPDEQAKLMGTKPRKGFNLGEAHSRLTAYAAYSTEDPALAARAWAEFFRGAAGLGVPAHPEVRRVSGPAVLHPVDEGFGMSTNAVSQWGLTAIANLALIGKHLPETVPVTAPHPDNDKDQATANAPLPETKNG
jgi:hypothetical protein